MSAKKNKNKISEHDKLVIDIRSNLTTRLTDLMSKLLNSAQGNLFDMSEAADSNEDQTRYFDLMNQIRTLKPEIASDFDTNIKAFLIPAKDFEAKQKQLKVEHDNDDELSLIDQEDMEGIVLVKGIGERAGGKYREQLQHLEARFEHLSLQTKELFTNDALSPTNFCQAFDDALSDNFNTINKKILFGMFEVEITNKLDALYDSINNRMIDADILPQIKLHTQKQKPSRPRPKPQQNPEANEEDTQQQDYADDYSGGGYAGGGGGNVAGGSGGSMGAGGAQGGNQGSMGQPAGGGQSGGGPSSGGAGSTQGGSNISGFAMTAAPGGNYRHNNPNAVPGQDTGDGNPGASANPEGGGFSGGENNGQVSPASGQGSGYQGGSQNGGASSANASENQGSGGDYQHYTAGMPASQVGRVLGNYISGAPITPATNDQSSKEHVDYYPQSTPQHFGHQEIIQALSGIQNLPQFDQPTETKFDGDAIKQAVLHEIAKTSGGAVTKRINQIAEKTIDFIELIFDAIIDDEDISDTVKTLLLRMQIPIIKASMSDQEFFIYDDHPARVLLDTIADVGVGITEHTDEMYKKLDKIITNILGEYELTTDTFQKALDNLNAIIEEQEAQSRAIEEEEQQQILRKHARSTVLKALRASTTGKTLPDAVHPLVLKRWPTLMFNHYLKKGKENNEWVNLVLTLRHIVESVQPVTSPEQLAKLHAEIDELYVTTEDYLNVASNSKKDVQNIMASYKETIEGHCDDANFNEEEVTAAEEEFSQAEPVEEPPIEEEIEKNEIPPNVMPGMWFQVYMGEDQVARRCKLSVIIVEDANLMFVNHKGELVTEKSFDEFNEEVADETTKMIMGHSAFDHAFKSVINRLN